VTGVPSGSDDAARFLSGSSRSEHGLRNLGGSGGEPSSRAVAVAVGIALISVLAAYTIGRNTPIGTDLPPWWVVAAVYGLGEITTVRIRFLGRDHLVSFDRFAFGMGLFSLSPVGLLTARAVGGAVALLPGRRRSWSRAVFATAVGVIGTTGGATVFSALASGSTLGSPWAWSVLILAVVVSVLIDPLGGNLVTRPLERISVRSGTIRTAGVLISDSVIMAALGVMAVAVLLHAPRGFFLVAFVTAVLMLTGRAHATRNDDRTRLDLLLRFSTGLKDAVGTDAVARAGVLRIRELLSARDAEILLARRGAPTVYRWHCGPGNEPTAGWVELNELEMFLEAPRGWVRPAASPVGDLVLGNRGVSAAVVLSFTVDEQTLGVVFVGDPGSTGDDRGTSVDLRLARSLVDQVTVALRHARSQERARHAALHDALTGLPNRGQFRARAVEAADEATGGRERCAIGILNLDGFTTINGSLGHLVGDQVLAEAGRRLASLVGDRLMLFRTGGDEFAVVSRGRFGREQLVEQARTVLSVLHEPFVIDGERVRLTASLGLALGPEHGATADQLLRCAETAMRAAKGASGGLQVYSRRLAGATDTSSIAADLRMALARGDLTVVVQPLVDLRSGTLHSVETLSRWRHPVFGPVDPETFVQVAEQAGLLAELTGFVIERALRACRMWREQGREIRVAVNLAARSLADPQLPRIVEDALRRHQVPGHLFCLELTETGVITSPDQALAVLGELRDLGISIAVDDFGTGYSSLTYMRWLSPDQIKIDKGFVQRLRFEPRSEAIVRSIIQLGGDLEVDVVAEGIGDARTATLLSDLGCAIGQGYLFAEPMPPENLPDWVVRWMAIPDGPVEPGTVSATLSGGIPLLTEGTPSSRQRRRRHRVGGPSGTIDLSVADLSPRDDGVR
jgi:diguanylate cyclase (GGDEF)-like protein